MQKTNDKGIKLIKDHEGLRLKAYKCQAGRWTIGYGHTKNVFYGMVITQEMAEAFFKEDLEDCERILSYSAKVPLTNNQFSALVSMMFNFGTDKIRKSTLMKRINSGASAESINSEWRRWIHVKENGITKVSEGLVKRREAEIALFWE